MQQGRRLLYGEPPDRNLATAPGQLGVAYSRDRET